MDKQLFKNAAGDIHFGLNPPEGFLPCEKKDAVSALKKIGKKKLWRCYVCDDLHFGVNYPDPCPTCITKKSYGEIDLEEFRSVIGL